MGEEEEEDGCVDSPLPMSTNKGPRDCEWVAQKATIRCSKPRVSTHCPDTCESCEDIGCADSERKFRVGNKTKRCRYFKKKPDKRCVSDAINQTCRVSCGFCNPSSSSATKMWE